jgi:hypothetical protein
MTIEVLRIVDHRRYLARITQRSVELVLGGTLQLLETALEFRDFKP